MVERDAGKFAAIIVSLAEVFNDGKEPSKALIKLYWHALKGYTVEQVHKAAGDILRERVFPSLPKPAEIIEAIRGSQGDRAIRAWIDTLTAIRKVGSYKSVKFSDPVIHAVVEFMGGWPAMGEMRVDEEKWKQREFERLYACMESGGGYPEYLLGLIEKVNGSAGAEPPVLIGFDANVRLIESKEVAA
ncbi:MAG: hypothetical protein JW724_03185 [Candidatus Altiarchaeota archaeon]|nr:hypothetical protein [Candidatus Altiarchaeota archaeon]